MLLLEMYFCFLKLRPETRDDLEYINIYIYIKMIWKLFFYCIIFLLFLVQAGKHLVMSAV